MSAPSRRCSSNLHGTVFLVCASASAVAGPGCRLHTRAFERAVLGLVLASNHLHKVVSPLPSKPVNSLL